MKIKQKTGVVMSVGVLLSIALIFSAQSVAAEELDPPYLCQPGNVCLYDMPQLAPYTWDWSRYYYGCYNLENEWGTHLIENAQTGGARVLLCYKYGCKNCFEGPAAGWSAEYNLDQINSIKLTP